MGCAVCSPQHFAESSLEIVVVMPGPHQLAQGKAIQLTDRCPLLWRQVHAPCLSSAVNLIRQRGSLLPGLIDSRRKISDDAIGHLPRNGSQVLAHLIDLNGRGMAAPLEDGRWQMR